MSKGLKALNGLVACAKTGSSQDICLEIDKLKLKVEKELISLQIIKAIGVFNVYEDAGGKYHLETMVDDVGLMKEDYDLLKEILE